MYNTEVIKRQSDTRGFYWTVWMDSLASLHTSFPDSRDAFPILPLTPWKKKLYRLIIQCPFSVLLLPGHEPLIMFDRVMLYSTSMILPSIPILTRHVIIAIPILVTANFFIEKVVFLELLLCGTQIIDENVDDVAKTLYV